MDRRWQWTRTMASTWRLTQGCWHIRILTTNLLTNISGAPLQPTWATGILCVCVRARVRENVGRNEVVHVRGMRAQYLSPGLFKERHTAVVQTKRHKAG